MELTPQNLPSLLEALCALALKAGESIVPFYKRHGDVVHKPDHSPVTAADLQANRIILQGLSELAPQIPVISEESPLKPLAPGEDFFLVDPLDGTKEFIAGHKEFTVNIALVRVGAGPFAGVIHAPLLDRLFHGWCFPEPHAFERTRRLHTRAPPSEGLFALTSRSHRDPKEDNALKSHRVIKTQPLGSSLKFCLIAAGDADIYIRHGQTKEWDTAAGHAILKGAGGDVTDERGTPLTYGKADYTNPPFIARG